MPIRPENKARYPADWAQIRARILTRAGNRCEWPGCGAANYQPHPITGAKVVLTIMHLNHVPEDCSDTNLLAACQRCHNRHDAPNRRRNASATRARQRAGLGQLALEASK